MLAVFLAEVELLQDTIFARMFTWIRCNPSMNRDYEFLFETTKVLVHIAVPPSGGAKVD